MTETTVGIDIGTTSVKAVAADAQGQVVARARVPHRLSVPAAGRFEHDPAEAWRSGVWAALRQLGDPGDLGVRAINVSAMVPSLAAFGPDGEALTAGLLYGDQRGAQHKTPASDEGELLGFLEWMVEEAPGAAGYWPAQGAANHALGGRSVIDTTCAATTTPVWFGNGWNAEVLEPLGLAPGQLPDVADLGCGVGRVSGTEAVLAAGSIDAMGEQIVSGAEDPGDVLVICGTTLIVWAAQEGWPEVPALWTIPSMTTGSALVGGPSDAGGLFLDWVRKLVGEGPPGEEVTLAPGQVPCWQPWPRGERVPLHDRSRRATIDGLDLTHGPAEIRRAAFEASAHMVRALIERAIGGEVGTVRRIVVTGGGVRVHGWVQAIADVCGRPVETVGLPEGGALGSAWFARMAAGLEDSIAGAAAWASRGPTVEPAPAWVEPCTTRYRQFVKAHLDG